MKLKRTIFFICLLSICSTSESLAVGTHLDFDDFPLTGPNETPGNSPTWTYSSEDTNTDINTNITCGYWSKNIYSSGLYDYVSMYKNTYNTSHMGYTTFGFIEIDNSKYIHGNSLRIRVTGGYNEDGVHGLELFTKEQFLAYLQNGQDPIYTEGRVGHPYLYFMNTGDGTTANPLEISQGANRLSMYVYLPEEVSNQENPNPNDLNADDSIHIGPYNGVGGHWYCTSQCQGGGWIHILVDSHPQGNNSYAPPYPSSSYRDQGADFFNNMYRYYFTLKRYEGLATPEYSVWVDEIKFFNDTEPQNNETINEVSVMLHPDTKTFEVSFGDKYMNSALAKATYQMRYSFSPITNDNWGSATNVHIQENIPLGVSANENGEFRKINPYRRTVWAPFKLANDHDESLITAGRTIYFAIKDVSQDPSDMRKPRGDGFGRDYIGASDSFDDFNYDQTALKLIKRIDYFIAGDSPTPVIRTIEITP